RHRHRGQRPLRRPVTDRPPLRARGGRTPPRGRSPARPRGPVGAERRRAHSEGALRRIGVALFAPVVPTSGRVGVALSTRVAPTCGRVAFAPFVDRGVGLGALGRLLAVTLRTVPQVTVEGGTEILLAGAGGVERIPTAAVGQGHTGHPPHIAGRRLGPTL